MNVPKHPQTNQRRQTMIFAGSMFGGLLATIALVAGPFAPEERGDRPYISIDP